MQIVLTLVSVLFLGCSVELQDLNQSQQANPAGAGHQLQAMFPMAGAHFEIQEGEGANEYKVKILAPSDAKSVTRESVDGQGLVRLQGDLDQSVSPGSTYLYRFIGSQVPPLILTIPQDLIVEGIQNSLGSELRYRRILLKANSVLVTNGKNTEIWAEQIMAEAGSRIQSFNFMESSKAETLSTSAGNLSIRALRIEGELSIYLSGRAGADGETGPAYSSPAAKGHDAIPGFQWRRQVADCKDLKRGGRGTDGLRGHPGYPGKDGGAGGQVEIEVADHSRAKINSNTEGGLGGRGGLGGPGQEGGSPGLGESGYTAIGSYPHEIQTNCPLLDAGPGTRGPDGREGISGRPGSEGQTVINGIKTNFL